MRKSLCFMRPVLSHLAWLRNFIFRETSPVPYCMAQEFAMLYDTHYTMTHTGAQLSGSGAQLSGSGAQLSGSGAQLSAISAYLHTSYLGAQLSASRLICFVISSSVFWIEHS